LVKNSDHRIDKQGKIYYAAVGEDWKKEKKYAQLDDYHDLRM